MDETIVTYRKITFKREISIEEKVSINIYRKDDDNNNNSDESQGDIIRIE